MFHINATPPCHLKFLKIILKRKQRPTTPPILPPQLTQPTYHLVHDLVAGNPNDNANELALQNICKYNENNLATYNSLLAHSTLPHSTSHQWSIDEVTHNFLTALIIFPDNKWNDALKHITYTGLNDEDKGTKILVQIEGPKDNTKLMLANKAIIDWIAVMKKNK